MSLLFFKLSVFCLFALHMIHATEKLTLKNPGKDTKSSGELVPDSTLKEAKIPNKESLVDAEKTLDSQYEPPEKKKKKHILMFHPWGTQSHMGQFKPLIHGLLKSGNMVTAVFVRETKIIHDDYTEIIVEDGFADSLKLFVNLFIQDERASIGDWMDVIPIWNEMQNASMTAMFEQDYKLVIESVRSRNLSVDSMILTGTFPYNGLYLGYVFQCPIVLFSNIGFGMHMTRLVGNLENPSYQTDIGLPFIEPFTFKQRLINVLVYYAGEIFPNENGFLLPLLKEKAGMSYEDIENVYSNISLVLQAAHLVTHNAQAISPNVVNVGGIHCKPAEKLPEDLKKFMDDHEEGVVYVSFGSAIKPSDMSVKRKGAFIEAFKKLKYQVIWKWNEDHIPDLPSNVMLTKWTPQQDLLAHPNLKVFVTHGGLLSLQEAIYHKTPLVGVPLGNDQVPNILRAEQKGYAVMLDWTNVTAEGLYEAIDRAINDPVVAEKMNMMNKIFLDQKESPVERAVYAIEYMMRHNGAHFLKPKSMGLYWYEFHHLDILLLVVFVPTLILLILIKLCMCCCRRICKSRRKRKVE